MGFQSQRGHVGFRLQSAKGSYLDPGDVVVGNKGTFVRTRGGSMGGNRELMIPDPEIGGNTDIPDALLSPLGYGGTYDFYARMEAVALLLYGALGLKSSSAAGSGSLLVGTHVITPVDNGSLPWLSCEEKIGDGFDVFKYTDCKVNTFHLEAAADGYLMGSVGVLALTQVAGGVATALAERRVDISPLLVGTNIFVRYNGVLFPAKSFSFAINNNLEDDDFRLGSLFLGDMVEKRRELTASVTIRPNDNSYWRQGMYGTPGATTPGGLVLKDDLEIICSTYENIGTSVVKHSLTLLGPQVAIPPHEVSPSGDDVLEADVALQYLRPDPAVPIITATVKNGLADVR